MEEVAVSSEPRYIVFFSAEAWTLFLTRVFSVFLAL